MKSLARFHIVLAALFMTTLIDCYAQQPTSVDKTVKELIKKHEDNKGVTCMTVAKGSGLEMVKMMFNKEFGKEFMKGVTSITIIEYSEASEETCRILHKDLDGFLSLLQEFDISKEKQFADNDFIRCFASVSNDNTLSDFVIALENDKSKMVMYMAGKIVVE